MAGDWMKIELELPDKPEVHAIAGMLNIDPDSVVGKLIRVWQWFDKHTIDGNALGVTYALPDRISGVTGFGEAMAFVGWLEQKDIVLHMPKFDRHTSESAKKRAQTAKRVGKSRSNAKNKCNADTVTESVTTALPREEKRREDIKTTTTTQPDGFAEFWSAYPKKVAKGDAEKAWKKHKPDLDRCLAALDIAKRSQDWTKDGGQFIPYPATWLNGKRWEDGGSSAIKPAVNPLFAGAI